MIKVRRWILAGPQLALAEQFMPTPKSALVQLEHFTFHRSINLPSSKLDKVVTMSHLKDTVILSRRLTMFTVSSGLHWISVSG